MYNVLIVDDEAVVRNGLKILINWEEYGFTVKNTASNGREALSLIACDNFDVIITDIRMPSVDGLELIRQIRERNDHQKIIIISAYKDFEYAKTAILYEVKNYILKPIDQKILVRTLNKIKKELDNEKSSIVVDFFNVKINANNLKVHHWKPNSLIYAVKGYNSKDIENEINNFISYVLIKKYTPNAIYGYASSILFNLNQIAIEYKNDFEKSFQLDHEIQTLYSIKDINGLSEFLVQTCCSISRLLNTRQEDNAANSIDNIKKYIEENYYMDITLNSVSKKFNYNPSYIGRIFKLKEGLTVRDYLNRCRIEKASEFLLRSNLKVFEIVEKVGYKDINHFYNIFKEIKGCTPSDIKRQ